MKIDLSNKVALVSASSKGMGFACAQAFAMNGAHVVICGRTMDSLESARTKLETIHKNILAVQTDVSKLEDIEKLIQKAIDRFGKIDILVNNAGGPKPGSIESLTEENWSSAIALNLMSTIRLSTRVYTHMKKNKWGRIVNITSIAAKSPLDRMALSNTVRAGVLGFAKTLSREGAPFGVNVNTLCPGAVATDRHQSLLELDAKEEGIPVAELKARAEKAIPVGFVATPKDFAQMALFLASEESRYITGTVIQVDGGEYRGLL